MKYKVKPKYKLNLIAKVNQKWIIKEIFKNLLKNNWENHF